MKSARGGSAPCLITIKQKHDLFERRIKMNDIIWEIYEAESNRVVSVERCPFCGDLELFRTQDADGDGRIWSRCGGCGAETEYSGSWSLCPMCGRMNISPDEFEINGGICSECRHEQRGDECEAAGDAAL